MTDIIIVNSNCYYAEWIAEQLAPHAYRIRMCSCSFEALREIIKRDRPALVILDASCIPLELPEIPAHTKLLAVFRRANSYFEIMLKRNGVYCIQLIEAMEILPIIRYILQE